jgi:eukaryotic-like serine/threonine-protein kinase
VLGEGCLGRIHLARTDKGARVVVRVFRPELAAAPEFRTRLREETEAAARVRGQRLVAVLDADADATLPWIATEHVPGPTVAQLVETCGPLSVDGVRQLGIALAEGLETLHDAGVVHHDLTPPNVVIGPDGPRLTGFAIAGPALAAPVVRGVIGTPGYLAPEQVTGEAVPESDLFALGALLLYAATWRAPFGPGDPATVLHRALNVDPDLNGVDPATAPVLAACLDRDATRRLGPMQVRDGLIAAVPAARPVGPVRVGPPRPAAPSGSSRARRAASVTAASVVLLGVLGGAAADTTRMGPATDESPSPALVR